MQTKIKKIGNSMGTIIPAAILKKLNLVNGDKINIEEVGGKIVITATKPNCDLNDLIANCDSSAPIPKELEEWDKARPVGNEKW